MIATNEKPRIWKCMETRLWFCIKDYAIGRGTTMRGAFNSMVERHKQHYGVKQ